MTDLHEGLLDQTYDRLCDTGPEFQGWLSNHGPMAADALIRVGRAEQVHGWVEGYARRLHEPPAARWPMEETEWRDLLGDASRLGDWCTLFARQVHQEPWADLLARWWPRLMPGAAACAAHGIIRTGHVVRALREQVTDARLDELGRALGYWAARWQPLPARSEPGGVAAPGAALDQLPVLGAGGGIRARLAHLAASPGWSTAVGSLRPVLVPGEVPQALDVLVDTAVSRYQQWAHGNPVMLVHAATAPRAAALVLPALPREQWVSTYHGAWAVTAAISSAYRPGTPTPPAGAGERAARTAEDVTELAVATQDEHAIKFLEVALESHQRGNNPQALPAAARAATLIAEDE